MPGRDAPDSKARLTGAVAFWALAGARREPPPSCCSAAHWASGWASAAFRFRGASPRPRLALLGGGAIGVVLGGIIGAWRLVG
jgi:membrane-associated PAP2 superfamily phosphatase